MVADIDRESWRSDKSRKARIVKLIVSGRPEMCQRLIKAEADTEALSTYTQEPTRKPTH